VAAEWAGSSRRPSGSAGRAHRDHDGAGEADVPEGARRTGRAHADEAGGHDHGSAETDGRTIAQRLRDPGVRVAVAQNAAMDFTMLWKDLVGGFLIAGALGAFCPRRCVEGALPARRRTGRSTCRERGHRSGHRDRVVRVLDRQRADGGDPMGERDLVRRRARVFCTPI